MLVRRLLLLAAVVAAGVLPTSTATAAGSKCVALVVDASSLGGAVSTNCVTVPSSASGADVLGKSGHRITFDPRYGDNFVCAIDGRPAGGCHASDSTHFWVYYHRAHGSSTWQESTEGTGTYRPANATTEGWVYDNGSSSAPQPANVPYSSICRAASKPTPSPTPTPTHSTASPVPTRTHPAATTPTALPRQPRHRSAATPTPTPTQTRAPTPLPTLTATPPATVATPAAARGPLPPSHSPGFPIRLVIAGVAVAAVAGAAVVRHRRSSR